MEELNGKLFRLLKDEIDSLSIGHTYNIERLRFMRDICHLLMYYKYVNISNSDIIKVIKFYEH